MTLHQCTQQELDHRSQRAEHEMNHALETRQWNLVQRYRYELLAVEKERGRRERSRDHLSDSQL